MISLAPTWCSHHWAKLTGAWSHNSGIEMAVRGHGQESEVCTVTRLRTGFGRVLMSIQRNCSDEPLGDRACSHHESHTVMWKMLVIIAKGLKRGDKIVFLLYRTCDYHQIKEKKKGIAVKKNYKRKDCIGIWVIFF